jgi:hypothetical protein
MNKELFQSLHSPVGAHAAFALGLANQGGGFMLEQDKVPMQDVFIGYREGKEIKLLPFIQQNNASEKDAFVKQEMKKDYQANIFPVEMVKRVFNYATDTFSVPGLSFMITNRYVQLPDLEKNADAKFETLPAIMAKMTIDNTNGAMDKEAIFAIGGFRRKLFLGNLTNGQLKGAICADGYGFAVQNEGDQIREFSDFDFPSVYDKKEPTQLILAPMSGLLITVKKGTKVEVDIVLGWYKDQVTTYGETACKYLYTKYYSSLIDVFQSALKNKALLYQEAEQNNLLIEQADLSEDRRFLIIQAAKSYYVSSMLFLQGEKVRWVMNEGSFLMMNTFDLIIDHMFFDLKYHPWVIRNQLELYAKEYSYQDQCGISFTHDQGSNRVFTPKGTSSYEIPNISDCFSYMTQEQLCNWILVAAVYVHQTDDRLFLEHMKDVILLCLDSMCSRDGEPYDGIMDIDSSKCKVGAEITTYDSLDTSLGQARRNLYIVAKCLASYLGIASLLDKLGMKDSEKQQLAYSQAKLCAVAISTSADNEGCLPAILKEENKTFIIPIVEGLIYPYYFGQEGWFETEQEAAELLDKVKTHMYAVLQSGRCLFEDGGWRLSASSDNSWISKIFLCQYVVNNVLNMHIDMTIADRAHVNWWKVGCSSNPGIDQIFAGTQSERGFHYPRAVTSTLWW